MMTAAQRIGLYSVALSVLALVAGTGPAAEDAALTETWYTPDGEGTFLVRTVGTDVWWVGKSSADDGKSWTNAFHGSIKDKKVTGRWANVNTGAGGDHGTMTLSLIEDDGKIVRMAGEATVGEKKWDFVLQRTKPKAK